MKAKILAQNIARGSGGHGLKVELLEKIFAQHEDKLDDLCYTFQKVISLSGPDYFSTQVILLFGGTLILSTMNHGASVRRMPGVTCMDTFPKVILQARLIS
jgi:hypothetical protein